jgi:signal transduction histidine kinase
MVDMQDTILPNANYQVVLPLQREKDVIGILFLESTTGPLDEETYSFLVRLGDHSAIAVANAQLYAAVQAANLAKSDFVSFVSHELKNPMTSIRGYTDLLSAGAVGPITETQSNFLETIRSNVNRMATLVTDLADVSRIEAGRLRLDFGEVRVSEVVDEVVRSLQSQFEDKNQRLQINIPDDLPKVWGDHVRLVQVMTNLVSNAHKYTPEDGEILVQADLLPEREQPRVRVLVKDDGIGMTPEDKRKIFTKFFRSEDQKAREAPGTGLGLNITKNLVEMQDGKIWFESEFRQGTTFYFTIPVAETQ